METFDTLWKYCSENNRAIPKDWHKLYQMLSNRKQISHSTWQPPVPLILGGWWFSTPREKVERFKEHIQWAFDNNQIEEVGKYLRALPEEGWFHIDELPSGKS